MVATGAQPRPSYVALLAAAVGLSALTGCRASAPEAHDDDRLAPIRAEAKALTDTFQESLKRELLAAMASGGPSAAIEVCKLEARKIAARVPGGSGKTGWTIGRTAMRVRNPANAPTKWQRRGLESFAKRISEQSGIDIASLEWHEVEGGRLRYMRAIPTGGLCLSCHGDREALSPEVKAKLAELYPEDQATGFPPGDLRGAFVVTVPL